jgi:hypothetical protein
MKRLVYIVAVLASGCATHELTTKERVAIGVAVAVVAGSVAASAQNGHGTFALYLPAPGKAQIPRSRL